MGKVRDILQIKGPGTFSVQPATTVYQALELMVEKNIGSLLVDDQGKFVGIFTERDYAREGEVKGRSARDTIVSDVMTSQMVLTKPETTLEECAELMGRYHVRHLPVIEKDRLVGIVSIRRLAEALLQQQQGTITELESYILGTGYGQ